MLKISGFSEAQSCLSPIERRWWQTPGTKFQKPPLDFLLETPLYTKHYRLSNTKKTLPIEHFKAALSAPDADSDQKAPCIDQTATDIEQTAPRIDQTATDIEQTAPRIDQTAINSEIRQYINSREEREGARRKNHIEKNQ